MTEMQCRPVVDRVAIAPFMGVQRLPGRVLDDEVWVALQAVDPPEADQWQRRVASKV